MRLPVYCSSLVLLAPRSLLSTTYCPGYGLVGGRWLQDPFQRLNFSWLAPEMLRGGQQTPNNIRMQVRDDQVRFDLTGSPPFKNNYISVLDFKTVAS